MRADMAEYMRVLHVWIDSFEASKTSCLSEIQAPDLSGCQKNMAILRDKVRSLVESWVLVIPLAFTFTQSLPPSLPIMFDLFIEKDVSLVVSTKRGQKEEL